MEYNTYLSDDEDYAENEENYELDQYGMPIENDDEDEDEQLEIRRLINNKILSSNLDDAFYNDSPKVKKIIEPKPQDKKTMSLKDLNIFIDKQIESKKPKKFISKRSAEKKSAEPTILIIKESKRQFNPKLIPYLFSEEYKNKQLLNKTNIPDLNNLEFPSL